MLASKRLRCHVIGCKANCQPGPSHWNPHSRSSSLRPGQEERSKSIGVNWLSLCYNGHHSAGSQERDFPATTAVEYPNQHFQTPNKKEELPRPTHTRTRRLIFSFATPERSKGLSPICNPFSSLHELDRVEKHGAVASASKARDVSLSDCPLVMVAPSSSGSFCRSPPAGMIRQRKSCSAFAIAWYPNSVTIRQSACAPRLRQPSTADFEEH